MKTREDRIVEIATSEDASWLMDLLAEAKRERHGRLARRVLEALKGDKDSRWMLAEDKAFGEGY